jgi:hypothetical protein
MRFTLARLPISPTYRSGARRERPQRVEIVPVAARHDDGVGGRRERVRPSQAGMSSTITSMPSGKRSALANFSRSSMTWTRKPTSCAILRQVEPTWPAPKTYTSGEARPAR